MYHQLKRGKELAEAHGVYTAKYDPVTLKFISQNSQEFSKEIFLIELYEAGIKDGMGEEFPSPLQGYKFVPSTFTRTSQNQYMVSMHLGVDKYHKDSELVIVRIDF